MSFSTEIEASLLPLREEYSSWVNGWLADGTYGITYPAFLLETYHYVKHSCALMRRARERLDERHETLRVYLREHELEETGHEQWVLDDLAALGFDRHEAARSVPLAETVAMIGSQLYVIDFVHPAGLIGYIYVMESRPPSAALLSLLHERFGIPREALTFLERHGVADLHHREELRDLLDSAFADESTRQAATFSATLGLSSVNRLFARLRSGDYLTTQTPSSPHQRKDLVNV